MAKRRILKFGAAIVTVFGTTAGLGAMAAGSSFAAAARPAHTMSAARPASLVSTAAARFTCYFPITGFYCTAQTVNGHAPLFRSNGSLYRTLPLNDKVWVNCWYKGKPPSKWKSDGIMDHVFKENISKPIAGHIPDYYVNFGNQTPAQAGVPKCK